MTERCQTKFVEKFDNQNNVIYVAIFVGSLAVLYFYRFHFVTVAFSYALGCVVCYYGLDSSILHSYMKSLKCHFVKNLPKNEEIEEQSRGCETCGSKDCSRHDSSINTDPWVGLQIHKQLDQAIEDFYNTIIDQFISSWYSKVTLQPFFIDELRHQLRYASSCLLRRAVKINYSRFITERLVPCALQHYTLCAANSPPDGKLALHPAAASRAAELRYLRSLTNAIMPYLLKNNELNSSVFRALIREIFAGWVLLSLTDVLADPYILNTLIILATGDETMAQLPSTPNYKVEFLETFVRQTDSVYAQRPKLLKMDLEAVINDQDHFYAFMQFMKTTGHLHLLQFYKDIKSFQTAILNPDLQARELHSLHSRACDMYSCYFSQGSLVSPALLPFAEELRALVNDKPDNVRRLQTSRALYQAARQSHAELEKIMLPKFLHSEEFYKLLIGSRVPTGYHKHMTKKPQENLIHSALKLGTKIKGALKSQAIDGQVLDVFTNSDLSDTDSVDNMDILKYLDNVATEGSLEQDLSTYKVVLTDVETRLQPPPRRGPVRVFTCTVHRAGDGAGVGVGAVPGAGASLWSVERSEHDFHLLRSKLHEFHGDRLLHDMPLPSRRDNSPMETLRYKYEDFLQRLLQKSLLQTSELLHLFLTVESDFSMVVQASTLNANSTDLANIYQSVTHKLRKEKGQHLESLLRNLLVSSDMERYQALKQGTSTHIEEAMEVSEDIEVEPETKRQSRARDIRNSTFGNNFDVEPTVVERDCEIQTTVAGFTQCCMFLWCFRQSSCTTFTIEPTWKPRNNINCSIHVGRVAIFYGRADFDVLKVVRAHSLISNIMGSLFSLTKKLIDDVFNEFLNNKLYDLLSERRLAHLIRLGHGLLFGKKASLSRSDPTKQREMARQQLLTRIPSSATFVMGAGLPIAIHTAFEIIQNPPLNKQLVYNLLDLCILELFPELSATDIKKEPKS